MSCEAYVHIPRPEVQKLPKSAHACLCPKLVELVLQVGEEKEVSGPLVWIRDASHNIYTMRGFFAFALF